MSDSFKALGATLFHYFAKADEAIGLELGIEPWINRIWETLPEIVEKVKNKSIEGTEENKGDIQEEEKDIGERYEHAKIYSKSVEADLYRKVIRLSVELDREISASENIEAGSYILVFPENDVEIVKEFIKICNWEESTDLLQKLTKDLDFLKPVHKNVFKLLTEGNEPDLYMKETKIFNYFDLIRFLKPSSPVNSEILGFIPTMKPRFYSLASDLIDTNKLEI